MDLELTEFVLYWTGYKSINSLDVMPKQRNLLFFIKEVSVK